VNRPDPSSTRIRRQYKLEDEVLDRLAAAYQPLAPEPITRDDAAEIADNLRRYFEVLHDWALEDAAQGVGPWATKPATRAEYAPCTISFEFKRPLRGSPSLP